MAAVISLGVDMKTLPTAFPFAGLTTVAASFSSSVMERPLMKGINSSFCLNFQNLLFFDSVRLHFPIEIRAFQAESTRRLRDIPVIFLQLRQNELPFVLSAG